MKSLILRATTLGEEAINQEIVLVTNAPKLRAVTLHVAEKLGMDEKELKSMVLIKRNMGRKIIFKDIESPKVLYMTRILLRGC